MTRLRDLWTGYWFRPAPLLDLAVLRIAIVLTGLYFGARPLDLHLLTGLPDASWKPVAVVQLLLAPLGLGARPPAELVYAIYGLTWVCGLLALIGAWTRISLACFAVSTLFITAHGYSFGDYHHPEALMHMALLALACSPAGELLSVDDLRRRLRENVASRSFTPVDLTGPHSEWAGWPILLTRWLFALVYFSAAISKLGLPPDLDWLNGYTLQFYLFQDGLRFESSLALWAADLPHWVHVLLSWVSVGFEGGFWLVLVFPWLALLLAPMGIGFHVGIFATLRAPFFQLICMYAVFIPYRALLVWARARVTGLPRVRLYYDDRCPLCIRSVTVVQYFDLRGRLAYCPLSAPDSERALAAAGVPMQSALAAMHTLDPAGHASAGVDAIRTIARSVGAFRMLGWLLALPGVRAVAVVVYRRIAATRRRFAPCSEPGACTLHGSGGAAGSAQPGSR